MVYVISYVLGLYRIQLSNRYCKITKKCKCLVNVRVIQRDSHVVQDHLTLPVHSRLFCGTHKLLLKVQFSVYFTNLWLLLFVFSSFFINGHGVNVFFFISDYPLGLFCLFSGEKRKVLMEQSTASYLIFKTNLPLIEIHALWNTCGSSLLNTRNKGIRSLNV